MKPNYTPLLIVISLFFLSLSGCREKGTPFSFTTPEGEEVSIIVPEGFEDQRSAKPWKKVYPEDSLFKINDYLATYVYKGDNPEKIMELYFILNEDPGTTKKWRRKPENRDLYNYIEYPDSNFICVSRGEYFNDPYTLYRCGYNEFPPDSHSADLYLQKQIFDIFICYPHDSLLNERAKTVMNDMVKSLRIRKRK